MGQQSVISNKKVEISPEKIHAVIFDMDGVVTQTASVHAIAWKRMFDDYLRNRAEKEGKEFVPFDDDFDYNEYVDGKPRNDGIKSFLDSRGIHIPLGSSGDSADMETIWGLGTKKNRYFLDYLKENGIQPYETTVELIKQLKSNCVKVGIISSSKNCKNVLEGAGVLDLFDTRVDGVYSETHHIKGKPAPDIFLEAAKQLGVEPQHSVVVEDAISGVQAGSKGNFALVIGVDRVGQEEALKENGADVVVKDLGEVSVKEAKPKGHGLDLIGEIFKRGQNKHLAIFLDYDGTMTPIVSRPDLAILSEEMRETLREVAKVHTVAIISGRDRQDVQDLVGVDDMFYAGSHGYDIAGPNNQHFHNDEAESFVPSIDRVERELKERLSHIEGALIERKRYGVAAHYRLVAPEFVDEFVSIIEDIHHNHNELRKTIGKKVFEFQPKINWNKGKALLWLLECLGLDSDDVLPFYIGDDVTDEDAFKALIGRGLGIAVQEKEKPTFGCYTLKNPDEVQQFLEKLIEIRG